MPLIKLVSENDKRRVLLMTLSRRYGWVCWYCGQQLRGETHIDHIQPKSAGGSDDESNLALACSFCNLAKQDLPVDVFLEWLDAVRFGPIWTPYRDGRRSGGEYLDKSAGWDTSPILKPFGD